MHRTGPLTCLAILALGIALVAAVTPAAVTAPTPVAQRGSPGTGSGSGGIASIRPDCARVRADLARLRGSGRSYAACTESARPLPDPGVRAFSGAGVEPPPRCQADWGPGRLSSCIRWRQVLRLVNLRTGGPGGTFTVDIEHVVATDPSALTWTLRTRIDLVRRSGPGTENIISEGRYECAGECEADSDYGPQLLTEDSPVTGVGTVESTTLGSSPERPEGYGRGKVTWDFQSPQWVPEEPQPSVYTPVVRCDDALPSTALPGCVLSEYMPRIDYSDNAFPDFVAHMRLARASGLPGFSAQAPLNRAADPSRDPARNGDRACPRGRNGFPRPEQKQCDEYPFRSTQQGAATAVPTGLPRTHDDCGIVLRDVPGAPSPTRRTGPVGYSVCMIDQTQNASAGIRLGEFYRYQRVLPRERFFVVIDAPGT